MTPVRIGNCHGKRTPQWTASGPSNDSAQGMFLVLPQHTASVIDDGKALFWDIVDDNGLKSCYHFASLLKDTCKEATILAVGHSPRRRVREHWTEKGFNRKRKSRPFKHMKRDLLDKKANRKVMFWQFKSPTIRSQCRKKRGMKPRKKRRIQNKLRWREPSLLRW